MRFNIKIQDDSWSIGDNGLQLYVGVVPEVVVTKGLLRFGSRMQHVCRVSRRIRPADLRAWLEGWFESLGDAPFTPGRTRELHDALMDAWVSGEIPRVLTPLQHFGPPGPGKAREIGDAGGPETWARIAMAAADDQGVLLDPGEVTRWALTCWATYAPVGVAHG